MKVTQKRAGLLAELRGLNDAVSDATQIPRQTLLRMGEIRHEIESLDERTKNEALLTPAVVTPAVAPLLADGGSHKPKCTILRTAEGAEVRAFGRGQRMADCAPGRLDGGLDLDGLGRAMAAMITGNSRGCEAELRALSEGSNTAGGFFVTEQLSAELVDLARSRSVMMAAGARVLDMQSDTLRLVTVTGDPTFQTVGENALIPSSDPSFGSLLLSARKHGVLVKCSNELVSDAAGAGAAITNALANAWAVYADGLLLDHLIASADIGGTGSIGAITWDDIIDARKAVAGENGRATHMISHPDTTAALGKLKSAVELVYLNRPSALDDLVMLETTGIANTSALVGDFTQAVFGQRGNLSIELSREAGTAFEYDQTFIRLLWRGDVGTLRPLHIHELSGLTY